MLVMCLRVKNTAMKRTAEFSRKMSDVCAAVVCVGRSLSFHTILPPAWGLPAAPSQRDGHEDSLTCHCFEKLPAVIQAKQCLCSCQHEQRPLKCTKWEFLHQIIWIHPIATFITSIREKVLATTAFLQLVWPYHDAAIQTMTVS